MPYYYTIPFTSNYSQNNSGIIDACLVPGCNKGTVMQDYQLLLIVAHRVV